MIGFGRSHREQEPDLSGGTLNNYFGGQGQLIRKSVLSEMPVKEFSGKVEEKKDYKAAIIGDVEGSLKKMGTGYLDCRLCPHGADVPYEATGIPEIFEAFELLKKRGKVRHPGFTAHSDPAHFDAAINNGMFSLGLVAYNFINHSFVDAAPGKAEKEDFGVLAMKAGRVLQNPFQRQRLVKSGVDALDEIMPGTSLTPIQQGIKWALGRSRIKGAVVGISDMEMAKQDAPLALESS